MTNHPFPPRPVQPFETALYGWVPNPDGDLIDEGNWPNSVAVSVVTGSAAQTLDDQGEGYADSGALRELVQIDTHYKPTRTGEYPVRLTRADAVMLAAHVLSAAEDTFHYTRCGRLRGREAAELLQALAHLDHALAELREHAVNDLIDDTGTDPDSDPSPPADDSSDNTTGLGG